MAPRGKKMRSLTDIIKDNRRGGPSEQQADSDLPTEVLELILSQLNLRVNIRASAVCKRWLAAAVSVRRANRSPWLMYFPKFGDSYEFFDPCQRKTHRLELPELRGSSIRYAKDGWLLLSRPRIWDIFLFCPYTRETIAVPKLRVVVPMAAFSAAPTSPNCVLFAVAYVTTTIIAVNTCRPGETQWSVFHYSSPRQYISSTWNQIVYCDDSFYCLSLAGQLGVFNHKKSTWAVYYTPPPKCRENISVENRWGAKFMAEHNGDVYVICTCAAANPFIYRLDRVNGMWVEMESLGGMTLFANVLSSHARTDLVGKMVGSVVFSKVLFHGKHCITYSPNHGRYYPRNKFYDWEEEPLDSIWIEAAEDASLFR